MTATFLALAVAATASGATVRPPPAANPILRGADPHALVVGDTIWIYPTRDDGGRGERFFAFSSTNLTDWQRLGPVLDFADVEWIKDDGQERHGAWAPGVLARNGKYYFYYSVGPQNPTPSRLGVAVGDSPAGPFRDSGKPLLTGGDGFEAIDPMGFTDPKSGKSYRYAGGSADGRAGIGCARIWRGERSGQGVGVLPAVGGGRGGVQEPERRPGGSTDLPPPRSAHLRVLTGGLRAGHLAPPTAGQGAGTHRAAGVGEIQPDGDDGRASSDDPQPGAGLPALHPAGGGSTVVAGADAVGTASAVTATDHGERRPGKWLQTFRVSGLIAGHLRRRMPSSRESRVRSGMSGCDHAAFRSGPALGRSQINPARFQCVGLTGFLALILGRRNLPEIPPIEPREAVPIEFHSQRGSAVGIQPYPLEWAPRTRH